MSPWITSGSGLCYLILSTLENLAEVSQILLFDITSDFNKYLKKESLQNLICF